MKFRVNKPALAALAIGMLAAVQAYAQSSVTFGRITHVRQVQVEDQGARAAGTLVGGALGVASGGSGRSSSNRALRGLGGAAVGSRAAGAMSRSTAFEYTVLVDGTSTIRMVTDTAGLRVGDCVAVERGSFNNLRMAPEERCDTRGPVPESARAESEACMQAKDQLLNAATDADFDRAERRMRLLCDH
jgi:outer membrane lipoprotein SlyB